MAVQCLKSGCIGFYIPSDLEISLAPWDFPRASGNLLVDGDEKPNNHSDSAMISSFAVKYWFCGVCFSFICAKNIVSVKNRHFPDNAGQWLVMIQTRMTDCKQVAKETSVEGGSLQRKKLLVAKTWSPLRPRPLLPPASLRKSNLCRRLLLQRMSDQFHAIVDQENMFVVKVTVFDTFPDYQAVNLAVVAIDWITWLAWSHYTCAAGPIWKTVQIHGIVQLCQKQIETGCIVEQLLNPPSAMFLKIWLHWQMSIIPNSSLVGSFTDNHGIGALRKTPAPITILAAIIVSILQ